MIVQLYKVTGAPEKDVQIAKLPVNSEESPNRLNGYCIWTATVPGGMAIVPSSKGSTLTLQPVGKFPDEP